MPVKIFIHLSRSHCIALYGISVKLCTAHYLAFVVCTGLYTSNVVKILNAPDPCMYFCILAGSKKYCPDTKNIVLVQTRSERSNKFASLQS